MAYELTFEIQGLPRMANIPSGKSHWRHAHAEKNKWISLVAAQVMGKKPPQPLEFYRLTLVRHSSVEPDFDGLVRGFKDIVDGLLHAGVLADDKIKNSGKWDCSWTKCKPKQGKVHITVTERTNES